MTVTFDDGTVVQVVPKSRDMVGAEAAGHDFPTAGPLHGMYAVAFSALQRMARNGDLPEGLELPASLADLIDGADVDAEQDEDPEGKG
jgi:hypothetical protein